MNVNEMLERMARAADEEQARVGGVHGLSELRIQAALRELVAEYDDTTADGWILQKRIGETVLTITELEL